MRWNPTKEEHYYQIMKVLEPWISKQQLEAWTSQVIHRFKRRDRIQYMLMLRRFKIVLRLLGATPSDPLASLPPQGPAERKKLRSLYWKFFDTYADPTKPLFDIVEFEEVFPPKFPEVLTPKQHETLWSMLQQQEEELEHLVDTIETAEYPTATAVIWKDQPINTPDRGWALLITQLQTAIEEDRSRIQEDYILPEDIDVYGGTLFLDCGSGFSWRALISEAQRKIEAQLMNHCAAPQVGIILSLREYVPGKGMRPHLTFEYVPDQTENLRNSVGTLREMKGYGNSKPSERYHDHIMQLLLLPNILGVVGGEYLSEKDFQLSDLSQQYQDIIRRKRPELYNPDLIDRVTLVRWAKARLPLPRSGPATKDVDLELVSPRFSDRHEAFQWIHDHQLLAECEGWSRDNPQKTFERLIFLLENPGDFFLNADRYHVESLSSLLDAVKRHATARQRFKAIIYEFLKGSPQAAVDAAWNAIEEQDWDEIPEELFDTLMGAGRMAEEVGWESGTLSEISKYLEDIFPLRTTQGVVTEKGVINTPQSILLRGSRGDEDILLLGEECQNIRRVLHRASEAQDFDSDAAIDYFLERLHEETP